jgi:hypothetical protein
MNHDAMSSVMFWVGALFVFTPILVVATVVGTTWYLRKKRKSAAAPSQS